jgi:alkylhydroperoxidase family enzyme
MATYLAPIEKPRGLMQKILYFFARRQFGKLPTPMMVYGARMPFAFLNFYGKVYGLDKKLVLRQDTVALIREHVAGLNMCLFCMDVGRWYASRGSGEMIAKYDALASYSDSSLFSDAEKAALDYARELAVDKEVRASTFAELAKYYSEREICEIVWLVASECMVNLTNIGFNIGSDGLCERKPADAARPAPRAVTAA